MADEERLARLEQRLAVLEGLVRQLLAARPLEVPPAERPAAPPPPPPPSSAPPPRRPLPPPPLPPRPSAHPSAGGFATRQPVFNEQWLGQRGLLAVGVVFVILAAGYLLKLSFDRGWVSPLARCIGGALSGIGVGALGWQLHRRGTRTYGAALVGLGAGIVYLAVWAAARLYQFLPTTPAIGALALVSLGLAGVAAAFGIEALATAATLGAFFAPLVVGAESASVNLLLVYLGCMGAAFGTLAATRGWRRTLALVALTYFGVGSTVSFSRAEPLGVYAYGILGGAAGLFVGLREGWWETRFLSFGGGWLLLGIADGRSHAHWITLLGGIVLVAPVWWRALTTERVWPEGAAFGESFYHYLAPVLLAGAAHGVAPAAFQADQGLLPLLVALPYLLVGLGRGRRPFTAVAALGLGIAAVGQWDAGLGSVWALLGLSLAWAAVDRLPGQRDARWYALGSLLVGLLVLHGAPLTERPAVEAAFTGRWIVALWGVIAVAAGLAAGLLRGTDAGPEAWSWRPALWALSGVLLLYGVTLEIPRFYHHRVADPQTAQLASGLTTSAWWICAAALCFLVGFRRQVRALRIAGFLVAGIALVKVVLVDLSQLDALYRVGSAFILGTASLAVAYAYHRQGAADAQP